MSSSQVHPHMLPPRMVPIASFYLGATPASSTSFVRPQSMSQASLPRPSNSPTSSNANSHTHNANRASMPVTPSSRSPPQPTSPFVGQGQSQSNETQSRPAPPLDATPEEEGEGADTEAVKFRHPSTGEMNRAFKFPRATSPAPVKIPARDNRLPHLSIDDQEGKELGKSGVITPSSIEVPAPPPVEKERSMGSAVGTGDEVEEEVGDTVDIPLN